MTWQKNFEPNQPIAAGIEEAFVSLISVLSRLLTRTKSHNEATYYYRYTVVEKHKNSNKSLCLVDKNQILLNLKHICFRLSNTYFYSRTY